MPDALAQLLDANLSQGVAYVTETETINFGDLAGADRAPERTAFAEALAGTGDKKSRAYKAQRRNVERWVKGRRPIEISRRRIGAARRVTSARLRAFREHGANVRLEISWYESRRPEWLPPRAWVHIPREAMRGVVRAWAEGDPDRAAGLLYSSFLDRYKVPNPDDWQRDVVTVGLRLTPTT